MDPTVDDTTTRAPANGQLMTHLRAMPVHDLRSLMAALDGLVGSPACAEAQADGVPCVSAANDCARCLLARTALEAVGRRLGVE